MEDRRCILCNDFVTADRSQMKRHVAIVHGDGTFSTLQCDVCRKKYYDFDHFVEHTREMSTCSRKRLLITPLSLNENLERAFLSLVDQMMKPVNDDQEPISSNGSPRTGTPKFTFRDNATSSTSVVQVQPSERQNKSLLKKPCVCLDVECVGSSDSPKIVSVMSLANQGRFVDWSTRDGTHNDGFQQGSETIDPMDLIEAAETQGVGGAVAETDKDGDGVEAVMDQETLRTSGIENNGPESATKSASQSITEKRIGTEDFQARMRRYHDGRVTCSVCNSSISVNSFDASHAVDHLKIHLPEPLLHCGFCNYKSNYIHGIRYHLFEKHDTVSYQFVDTTGNHIEELMEMANRCFGHDSRAGSLEGGQRTSLRQDLGVYGEDTESSGSPSIVRGSNQGGPKVEERRLEPCVNDLYDHSSQIIRRRQHENRATCSVCGESIVVFVGGRPSPQNAIGHARRHVTTGRVFQFKLCSQESNNGSVIRKHLASKHQSGSDQYTNTTADRIQDLMDIVSRCFDHDLDSVSIRETMQATGKPLLAHQWNQRYKISQIKRGGFSVPLQKINRGQRFGMRPESVSDKTASPLRFHGRTMDGQSSGYDRIIKQRPPSSPRVVEAKRACWEKVKKFMKDGKLECRLCSHKVMIASDAWKSRTTTIREHAYSHAVQHMNIRDLYECSTCRLLTKTKTGIYQHMRKHHGGGQAQLIDHTDRYYGEILKQFMACFDLESDDGESYEWEAAASKGTEQRTSVAGGDIRTDTEKLDQARCPTPKQVETAQDSKKWLYCDKCGFKSTFKILFQLHLKRMHAN